MYTTLDLSSNAPYFFSPKSRRNLLSFVDIRKNEYHLETFDEMNHEYLGVTKNVSEKKCIIEKFYALASGLYWIKISAIESTFCSKPKGY